MNKITKISIAVIVCLLVGYFSGMLTISAIKTWYPTLIKPSFNPPNWVFRPVWTLLYLMMGVAGGIIWNQIAKQKAAVENALVYFVIQLILNALWSFLFFGLQNPMLAGIEIVVLWLMIYETYTKFIKINTLAANLLIPYLAWVGFASILNASIWWLNR